LASGQKKTARHLCSGGSSVALVSRLAVPLRQMAREVEEKAEEPAMHADIET
jgi:short-subunit dehydrogenase